MGREVALILVLVLFLVYWYYNTVAYGPYNTTAVPVQNELYRVHRAHADQKAAAQLLADINTRNETLIEFLRSKYMTTPNISMDPTKNNRIDIIPGTSIYAGDIVETLNNPLSREYIQERVNQLTVNYSSDRIYEISPLNTEDATSYTENKRTLVFCLRHKTPNQFGEYELHDINTMMFVVLHELSHMMNNTWDHHSDFWILFKFLLLNAVDCGVYEPVNYELKPIRYCGLLLQYNPIFDNNL